MFSTGHQYNLNVVLVLLVTPGWSVQRPVRTVKRGQTQTGKQKQSGSWEQQQAVKRKSSQSDVAHPVLLLLPRLVSHPTSVGSLGASVGQFWNQPEGAAFPAPPGSGSCSIYRIYTFKFRSGDSQKVIKANLANKLQQHSCLDVFLLLDCNLDFEDSWQDTPTETDCCYYTLTDCCYYTVTDRPSWPG